MYHVYDIQDNSLVLFREGGWGCSLTFHKCFKIFLKIVYCRNRILVRISSWNFVCVPKAWLSAWNFHYKCDICHCIFSQDYFGEVVKCLWNNPQDHGGVSLHLESSPIKWSSVIVLSHFCRRNIYLTLWCTCIVCRTDSRFAPSQWEMPLQSNAASHWLGVILESALSVLKTRWQWRWEVNYFLTQG